MTNEAQQLQEGVKNRKAKRAGAGILVIGVSVMFGLIAASLSQSQVNGNALDEIRDTLNYTCAAAEGSPTPLPAAIRDNCKVAEQNRITEYVVGEDQPDPNDPESQDPENQEREVQDSERQDPERQDPETQDSEVQEPETQDPEIGDPELNEEEIQEEEAQEPEIQEPEIQEPEEQNYPVCAEGYTAGERVWYGPDGLPETEDDEIWVVCIKDGS